jgi:hypothetical protein
VSGAISAIKRTREYIVSTKIGTGKGIILLLSCAAQFMVVLDIAIVNLDLMRATEPAVGQTRTVVAAGG